jgi:hypothetical protein
MPLALPYTVFGSTQIWTAHIMLIGEIDLDEIHAKLSGT